MYVWPPFANAKWGGLMKNKVREYAETTLLSAVGYCVLEMLWRGRTHWSMAVAGGFCFSSLHAINEGYGELPLWRRCLWGAATVTAAELLIGCIVNIRHDWKVWDYSDQPGNIMGQICPLFSFLWFLLCMPLCGLSACIRKKISRDGMRT